MINLHKKPSIGFMVCRTSRGCDEKTLNWWFYLITFRNLKENNNEQMRFIKLLYIAIKIFIIYWEQSKNIRSCVFEEHVWLLDYYFFKIFFLKQLQYSYKNKHGLIILRRRQMNLNLLLQYYYDLFYLVTLFDFITIVVDNKKNELKIESLLFTFKDFRWVVCLWANGAVLIKIRCYHISRRFEINTHPWMYTQTCKCQWNSQCMMGQALQAKILKAFAWDYSIPANHSEKYIVTCMTRFVTIKFSKRF